MYCTALQAAAYDVDERLGSGVEKDAVDAEIGCGFQIGRFVADEETTGKFEPPFFRSSFEEPRAWLAAAACDRVVTHDAVRVMWTIIKGIDMGPLRPQAYLHVSMEAIDGRLIVVAASDTGLVRDHKDVIAGCVEEPYRCRGALDPLDLIQPMRVAMIDIQHAVAVEECGWTFQFEPAVMRRL